MMKYRDLSVRALKVLKSEDGVQNWIMDWKLDISSLKSEITALKKDLQNYRQGKSVDPDELKKLNKHLLYPLSENNILDKLDDIRRHPSDYVDLFENLARAIFNTDDI